MGVRFRYAGAITSHSRAHPAGVDREVDVIITFRQRRAGGRYGYRRVLKGPVAGVAGVQWRASRSAQPVCRSSAGTSSSMPNRDRSPHQQLGGPVRPQAGRTAFTGRRPCPCTCTSSGTRSADHVRDKRRLMYPRLRADRLTPLARETAGPRKMGNNAASELSEPPEGAQPRPSSIRTPITSPRHTAPGHERGPRRGRRRGPGLAGFPHREELWRAWTTRRCDRPWPIPPAG